MKDFSLSEHFAFYELTRAGDARLLAANRRLALAARGPLAALCQTLLEPVRRHFDRPVIIHSGFRSPALNNKLGGAANSQHLKGEAADFTVAGADTADVFFWLWRESGLEFGQLIDEASPAGGWLHLSLGAPWRAPEKCREVLVYRDGEYGRIA